MVPPVGVRVRVTGGITAQRLSKDKNADWRPRDRVHSTVAHNPAQHQHRRNQGSDNGATSGEGAQTVQHPQNSTSRSRQLHNLAARLHDADGRTEMDPNRLTRRALEV